MKSINKDSIGNDLPQSVFLRSNETDKIGSALRVNTFLLAAKSAMKNGSTVIYDKSRKSATITKKNGFQTTISH